ncbi:MAG: YitT family protein [Erysipelotrichia bacterium]|nr:YitT family protein [Erysipelotrichia bacterium]
MKNNKFILIKDIILTVLAAFIMAFNLNSFVHDGNITPCGFSGLAVLITRIGTKFNFKTPSYSILYLLFNLPATILVVKTVGKRFTFISLIDVVLTSVFVKILPNIKITDDLLLAAVFGGILNGVSNSLVLIGEGCGGGLDFISIYAAKKFKKSFWNEVMFLNALMICIAGVLFGWESALYSIIFQFVNTQVLNYTDNRFKRTCLVIITQKTNEVCQAIYKDFHHTVTIMDGIGGFTQEPRKVLYTVCGQYETNNLIEKILSLDPKAFINITHSQRVIGNFHEKPFY